MKTFIKCLLPVALFSVATSTFAHTDADNGVMSLEENRRPQERVHLQVPDIDGYKTIKCDFHMHTVFSDGLVWPTIRVQEAWQEGLDAIAITDHMEYQPHSEDIALKPNRAYEHAKSYAEDVNIILIRGTEITRYTPPGHFNAIFIKDASEFMAEREKGNLEKDKEAITRASDQGAFIFWNHPGWKVDKNPKSYTWSPFMQELLDEEKIHGIEVFNGFHFHRWALDWALDNNLAVMGTSDIHNLIEHDYDMNKGVTRTMNLLFVKERSAEGIREALDSRRTVAWSTRMIAGKEELIRELYNASVSVSKVHNKNKWGHNAEISNNSDLVWELERIDDAATGWPETISLNAHTTLIIRVKAEEMPVSAQYKVSNAYIRSDKNLIVSIELK